MIYEGIWDISVENKQDISRNYHTMDTTLYSNYLALDINATEERNFSEPAIFSESESDLEWGVLALSLLIFATILGNVLVCLAVCWESRLQNMTNYFLMSLAIADLLVALLVMPIGMIIELYGYFPFSQSTCVIYIAADILMCTASIWHMCTMSMDRYFTLKYPMKYGRNKTKSMVLLKITFVWIVSLSICSPIVIMGYKNYANVYVDGLCAPQNPQFVIYGSVLAFYVPLTIMVVTYILTTRILHNNQKLMEKISKQHTEMQQVRRQQNGGITPSLYTNMPFLTPNATYIRFTRRPSYDASDIENMTYDGLSGEYHVSNGEEHESNGAVNQNNTEKSFDATEIDSDEKSHLLEIGENKDAGSRRNSILSSLSASQPNLVKAVQLNESEELQRSGSFRDEKLPDMVSQETGRHKNSKSKATKSSLALPKSNKRNARSQPDLVHHGSLSLRQCNSQSSLALPHARLSKLRSSSNSYHEKLSSHRQTAHVFANSQPHLPSAGENLSPTTSPRSLRFPSIKSINSVLDLESVKNFDSLSNASSLNSVASQSASMWEDFERPRMREKLTQIEAEMDLCLMENSRIKSRKKPPSPLCKTSSPPENTVAIPEKLNEEEPLSDKERCSNAKNTEKLSDADSKSERKQDCLLVDKQQNNSNIASNNIIKPRATSSYDVSQQTAQVDRSAIVHSNIHGLAVIHRSSSLGNQEISAFHKIPHGSRSFCQTSKVVHFVKPVNEPPPPVVNESSHIDKPEVHVVNHVIPPVCISSPSPIHSLTSQASPSVSHSDLERDSSFKSNSSSVQDQRGSLMPRKGSKDHSGSDTYSARVIRNCNTRTPPNVQITACISNYSLNNSNAVYKSLPLKQGSFSSELSGDSNKPITPSDDGITSEECISEMMTQMTSSLNAQLHHAASRQLQHNHNTGRRSSGAHVWKLFRTKTRGSLRALNGYMNPKKNVISKKTATNERKASKVLGIIFAVFVILWTPFFVINILTSVCQSCHTWLSPSVFTTLTWLGYVSSLMNPIIYTMFNTSFRKAFHKILTCRYQVCCKKQRLWRLPRQSKGGTIATHAKCLSVTTVRQTSGGNGHADYFKYKHTL